MSSSNNEDAVAVAVPTEHKELLHDDAIEEQIKQQPSRARSLIDIIVFLAAFAVFFTIMIIVVILGFTLQQKREFPVPTMVLLNFTIWTGDERVPFAQAMAIQGNKILDIGNNAYILEKYNLNEANKSAMQIIDAYQLDNSSSSAMMIVPGLIDSHIHLLSGGMDLRNLNMRMVMSKQQFVDAVTEFVKTRTAGQWILGGQVCLL